jgi:hypothetical protein
MPISDSKAQLQSLFDQCAQNERKTKRADYEQLRDLTVEELAFSNPVIPSSLSGERWRYEYLLTLLRRTNAPQARWYVVANWLKHENVCRPRDFLPKQVFEQLTTAERKRVGRIPYNDFYYAQLINAWLPCCESVLHEIKNLKAQGCPDLVSGLRTLGYKTDLVEVALGTRLHRRPLRSPIALACQWLAERQTFEAAKKKNDPDPARMLRNAYARVSRYFQCAFCKNLAVGELRAGQAFAAHCKAHSAEWLLTSLSQGWSDRYGRRWWRENENVCCSAASSTET